MVKKTGYQGFGSFMSEKSVAEMLVDTDRPRPPIELAFSSEGAKRDLEQLVLGADARPHFAIDFSTWTFINHGAFGAPLRAAMAEANRWREHCETQPLAFLDRQLFPQVIRVIKEMSEFVHCDHHDLVFLPNATTGLNTVIQSVTQSLHFSPDDAILTLDIGYGSVRSMIDHMTQFHSCRHTTVPIKLPCTPDSVLEAVEGTLLSRGGAKIKLAVIDAVTSNTGIVLPIVQLTALFHQHGVQVLIDGAHALGMLDLNLEAIDADYFVANCHKWLCSPRGSAWMYVRRDRQPLIKPLIISWGHGYGFTGDFLWDGCRDYSPILATSAALTFWNSCGPARIRQYIVDLRAQVVARLTKAWTPAHEMTTAATTAATTAVASGIREICSEEMLGGMALVALPIGGPVKKKGSNTPADAKYMQDLLHFEYLLEVPIKNIEGTLFVRISCHVYNVLDDYVVLEEAVKAITARGEGDLDAGVGCKLGGGCGR